MAQRQCSAGGVVNADRVLASHPDAPWLPAGGSAHVVLAAAESPIPAPICMVRLLATRGRDILTVTRDDGRGVDIPSVRVGSSQVQERLEALMLDCLGALQPVALVGYVRNVVTEPTEDYPWPVPDAYFAVWHSEVGEVRLDRGQWTAALSAESGLEARHWWPLAAHVQGLAG